MASRYRVGRVDENLENNAHAHELRLIGPNQRVLELGAAAGDVTRALVKRGCKVTVVERDESNRDDLAEAAEVVVIGDLNDPATLDAIEGQFDTVLCGDVLEHLIDPQDVLTRAAHMLTPTGQVVASIPNIAHIDARLMLLEGRFDYMPLGLMDSTHIRFFTGKTIEEMVEAAGLVITKRLPVRVPPFGTELGPQPDRFPASLIEEILKDPDAQTYQFVFAAVPIEGALSGRQLANRLVETRRELERVKAEHGEASARLAAYQNSRTLRYTAWLRAIARWLLSLGRSR